MVPPNYLTVLWLTSRVTPPSTSKKTSMISTFQNIRSLVRVWWWMTRPDRDSRQWPKPSAIRRCLVYNQSSLRSLWPSLISMINNPWNCCSTSWWARSSRILKPHKSLRWKGKFRIYKIKSRWESKSMRMSRCNGKLSKTLNDKFTNWNNNKNQPSKSQGENAASQFRKWNAATVLWSMCPNLTWVKSSPMINPLKFNHRLSYLKICQKSNWKQSSMVTAPPTSTWNTKFHCHRPLCPKTIIHLPITRHKASSPHRTTQWWMWAKKPASWA